MVRLRRTGPRPHQRLHFAFLHNRLRLHRNPNGLLFASRAVIDSGWARAHRVRNSADSYRTARAVPLLCAFLRYPTTKAAGREPTGSATLPTVTGRLAPCRFCLRPIAVRHRSLSSPSSPNPGGIAPPMAVAHRVLGNAFRQAFGRATKRTDDSVKSTASGGCSSAV